MVENLDKDIFSKKIEYNFMQGVKDCMPTIIGYLSVSFACGIVGAAAGLNALEMFLLALLVYSGAGQFIICGLVAAGTPVSAIVFTIFVVNLRHFLLCASLAPTFSKYSLLKNISLGALVTDEVFGVAMTKILQKEPITDKWMRGHTLAAYFSWVSGCVLGVICGSWIENPRVFGVDFALVAMFVALLFSQLLIAPKSKLNKYLFLIGIVTACMFLFSVFFETYWAVLFSTIVGASVGMKVDHD